MRLSFLRTNKMSILSMLLVAVAAVLGADCSFAMAVAEPVLSGDANPSSNMGDDPSNGGRPSEEALHADEYGANTQLQGRPATGTDVTDAGLEAEDFDADIDEFRKHMFPEETLVAHYCKPVKVNSYIHGHYRHGTTRLEAIIDSQVQFTPGTNTAGTYVAADKILTINASAFDDPTCFTEYSTVNVRKVKGENGGLLLFVLNHKNGDDKVKFKVLNPPTGQVTIPAGTKFYIMSTACSESQMRVASRTYLPEKVDMFLQKKIESLVITDYFDKMTKKVTFAGEQVIASAEFNFKRLCARTHLDGEASRFDIDVPETGGRERIYTEKGIIRQIPMMYTLQEDDKMSDSDLLALTTMMFTNNSVNNEAYVLCGKNAMTRFINLVNSAEKYRDVGAVRKDKVGLLVRDYVDNFGSLHFIWSPSLDDLGYEEYMLVVDFKNATRPYMVNDKRTVQDMKKTGESREASVHNLCRIDCVALNGNNAVLVVPSSEVANAANLGGITASVATATQASALTDHEVYYYIGADFGEFKKGDVVKWNGTAYAVYKGAINRA